MFTSKQSKLLPVLLFSMLFFSLPILADDSDIYINNVQGSSTKPYVMFMLDYQTNLGSSACTSAGQCDSIAAYLPTLAAGQSYTKFDVLRAVLKKVLEPLGGLNIGLMMSHAHDQGCTGPLDSGCSGGGYVVQRFLEIQPDVFDASGNLVSRDTNKQAFHAKLNNIPIPGGTINHSFQAKELYWEFYRYLTAQGVWSGHLGYRDFGDRTVSTNLDDASIAGGLALRDMAAETNADGLYNTPGTYITPFRLVRNGNVVPDHCAKIFTVNFMFQTTSQDADTDTQIQATTGLNFGRTGGGGPGAAAFSSDDFQAYLNWLYTTDLIEPLAGKQNVTSFFIDSVPADNSADGYANAGGTSSAYEWSDDPEQLVKTLSNMFREILSVSTTFTAASVPVSVLNRAEIIDNVYIALFRADADGKPRWPGNLKKLRLDLADPNALLKDANNVNAVAQDGRIHYDALTYWTDPATLPPANPDRNEVAGRDGRSVARGGAGQKIPGFLGGDPGTTNAAGSRILYYEDTSDATTPVKALDAGTGSNVASDTYFQTNIGSLVDSTKYSYTDIALYMRGYDRSDDDGDNQVNEARPWMLGDPLHSRPLPINYGQSNGATVPDIRIFMGGNDGFMHQFKNTDSTGGQLGTEVWGYMPRLTMGIQQRLLYNQVGSHLYGVDGPPSGFVEYGTNGVPTTARIYFGLRRGGKGMYALDVTNPDSAPTKLWTIEKTSGGQFDELGLTFSAPRVSSLDGYINVTTDNTVVPNVVTRTAVAVFAGGYDVNKDTRAVVGSDDTEGNALYIVNAETGALIWKAVKGTSIGYDPTTKTFTHPQLTDSIPSTVTTADAYLNDGLLDRIYFGDTGGKIWRVDLHPAGSDYIALWPVASVGRHAEATPTNANDRRFFHRIDFVQFKDNTSPYDGIIVGSGDRTDPLSTDTNNAMFMIKDREIYPYMYGAPGLPTRTYIYGPAASSPPAAITTAQLGDVTNNCLQDASCGNNVPSLYYGWKMFLDAPGEKILATATTLAGHIYFTSYLPPVPDIDTNQTVIDCSPSEGEGRLYTVSMEDATAVIDYIVTTDGILTTADRHRDLSSAGIPAEVVYLTGDNIMAPDLSKAKVKTKLRWKTYWHPEEQ